MTEQQRVEAFQQVIREAGERYGVNAYAVTRAEQLGPVAQVRAVLVFEARQDWTPPADNEGIPNWLNQAIQER